MSEYRPAPGSRWRHHSGAFYEVVLIANLPNSERYPETVVYRGENGQTWARPLSDWHRSMTRIEPPKPAPRPAPKPRSRRDDDPDPATVAREMTDRERELILQLPDVTGIGFDDRMLMGYGTGGRRVWSRLVQSPWGWAVHDKPWALTELGILVQHEVRLMRAAAAVEGAPHG
jgi:hypothetical protein